jgi:hypothetical protein
VFGSTRLWREPCPSPVHFPGQRTLSAHDRALTIETTFRRPEPPGAGSDHPEKAGQRTVLANMVRSRVTERIPLTWLHHETNRQGRRCHGNPDFICLAYLNGICSLTRVSAVRTGSGRGCVKTRVSGTQASGSTADGHQRFSSAIDRLAIVLHLS